MIPNRFANKFKFKITKKQKKIKKLICTKQHYNLLNFYGLKRITESRNRGEYREDNEYQRLIMQERRVVKFL